MWVISLHPGAEVDAAEGVEWYDLRNSDVAIRFADALDDALASILIDPLRCEVIASDIRAFTVRGFPYRVIFRPEDGVVWVLAVAHHARRSGYWNARLDG